MVTSGLVPGIVMFQLMAKVYNVSSDQVLRYQVYDEDFIKDVTISSKVISENYIKIFLLFDENIEDDLYRYNPKLKPKNDNRGIVSEIQFSNGKTCFAARCIKMRKLHVFIDTHLINFSFEVLK